MIKFLNDETVAGYRYGKGAVLSFDPAIEAGLIERGDAVNHPLPLLISQSYAPFTRSSTNGVGIADTEVQTLATVIVPGGMMNKNGKIVIEQDWKYTSSASVKTLRVDWGGVWVSGPTATTSVRAMFMLTVKNLNSLSVQSLLNFTSYGTSTIDPALTSDTAKDVAIDFRCQWGANVASEQIILLGYSVWYYPGNS